MAQKSVRKNYLYNLCYQILLLIAPLVTTPYVSRVLGADGIGTVSYAESVVSYFTLFATLGITTYGQREISYVQDSVEKRSIVFWNAKVLEFCTAGFVLIIYIIFVSTQIHSTIYFILTLNILAVFSDVTWFFQGMEEFGKIVFRNFIFKILNIAYIFIFVRSKDDVVLYVLGIALFLFLSNLSLWAYIPKYVIKIPYKYIHPFTELPVVLSLFVPTIAIQIYTVLDKTLIGLITKNAFENGYYEQALKLSRMVLTIVTALGTVMIPRIGYFFEKKNTEEVRCLMYRGYRFVWFLGIPLCIGLICVSSNFVPWFFGKGYEKVTDLLAVLAFLIPVIGINNVTGMQYLIPTRRQNMFTLTVMIGAVTNFILNAALIPIMQSMGAAIASVAAESVIAVVQLIMVRKELSVSRILKEGIHYYIAVTVMSAVLILIGRILSPSIMHTGILVVCGAIVYLLMLLLMEDEFLISNIRFLSCKIHK